jgi:hypothetical protein
MSWETKKLRKESRLEHATKIEAMKTRMHLVQSASSVTVIQMKLMKVVRMIETRMVQELQHWTELQLTEDPRWRRPKTQSALILHRL